jgi:hypothetical protein
MSATSAIKKLPKVFIILPMDADWPNLVTLTENDITDRPTKSQNTRQAAL